MRANLGKSEAERHREQSHANLKINLDIGLDAIEKARDWELSWPNNITNLTQDLEQMRNRLRIMIRSVEPVDPYGHVRIVPGVPNISTKEDKIIVIGDD